MPVTPVFRGRGWPWLHSETQSQKDKIKHNRARGRERGVEGVRKEKKSHQCGDCLRREISQNSMSVSSEIKCDILPVINHYYVFLAGYYSVSPDSRGGNHRRAFLSAAQTFVFIHKGRRTPFGCFSPLENQSFNLCFCSVVIALVMRLIEASSSRLPQSSLGLYPLGLRYLSSLASLPLFNQLFSLLCTPWANPTNRVYCKDFLEKYHQLNDFPYSQLHLIPAELMVPGDRCLHPETKIPIIFPAPTSKHSLALTKAKSPQTSVSIVCTVRWILCTSQIVFKVNINLVWYINETSAIFCM